MRIATINGTNEKYRIAIVKYLNAMINDDKEAFDLLQKLCEKEIFQKLVDAGLTKIN
jgi:hypothetical protein